MERPEKLAGGSTVRIDLCSLKNPINAENPVVSTAVTDIHYFRTVEPLPSRLPANMHFNRPYVAPAPE